MPNNLKDSIPKVLSRTARKERRAERAENRARLIQQAVVLPQPVQQVPPPAPQANATAQIAQQQAQALAAAQEQTRLALRELETVRERAQQEKAEAKQQEARLQRSIVDCKIRGRQLAVPAIKKLLEKFDIDWANMPDQKLGSPLPAVNFSTLGSAEKEALISGATEQSQKVTTFLLKAGCIAAAIKLNEKVTWISDNNLSIVDSALLTDGMHDFTPDLSKKDCKESSPVAQQKNSPTVTIEVCDDSINTNNSSAANSAVPVVADDGMDKEWIKVEAATSPKPIASASGTAFFAQRRVVSQPVATISETPKLTTG